MTETRIRYFCFISFPQLLRLTLRAKGKSEDINAFFFSIADHPRVTDKEHYSYNEILARDDDVRIIFIYFYASIIYHIAYLMKEKGIEFPKNVIFSGTGSKILNIITPDQKILSNFTKLIFEKVYGELGKGNSLTVHTEKLTPKEVTCKGGLMSKTEELEKIESKDINVILTCVKEKGRNLNKYVDLTEAVKNEITEFIKEFNEIFILLDADYSFHNYFNTSKRSLEIFKKELNEHLRDHLEEGVQFAKELEQITEDTEPIGETLFFYPLIGTINRLATMLSKLDEVK